MSEFQNLVDAVNAAMAEQDEMRKALAEQDDLLKAAKHPEPDADNAGGSSDYDEDNKDDEDEDEDNEDDEDTDEEEDEPAPGRPFGKSFAVTLDDGSTLDALDGTAVIEAMRTEHAEKFETMAKAMNSVLSLVKSQTALVKSQTATIGDLRKQIADLGRRPAGRKSVLNVHEKPDPVPDLVKAQPAAGDIMAKAMQAQSAGRLGPVEVAEINGYVNAGWNIPDHLLKALG